MLKINIITIGKLKESYLKEAQNEYAKRLSAHCKLNFFELPESRIDALPSTNSIEKVLNEEAERIMSIVPSKTYVIALCIEGKMLNSEELSNIISQCSVDGYSEISFVIGSSYGLHNIVKQRANLKLSMSKMTFPHMLAKILLLEQVYRGFKIIEGSAYHK